MTSEEAAFVIDQQLVQLGLDRVLDAEPLADAGQDRLQRLRPMLAGDLHLSRLDLPGAPHAGIIDGFRAAAERRHRRGRDELPGLKRLQRQGDLADAFDREPWRKRLYDPGYMKIAGPASLGEEASEIIGDRGRIVCDRGHEEGPLDFGRRNFARAPGDRLARLGRHTQANAGLFPRIGKKPEFPGNRQKSREFFRFSRFLRTSVSKTYANSAS